MVPSCIKFPFYANTLPMKKCLNELIKQWNIFDSSHRTWSLRLTWSLRPVWLIIGLLSSVLLGQLYMESHLPLYDRSLRFHVRASSDDRLEQELKLAVRDAILEKIRSQADEAVNAHDLEVRLKKTRQEIIRCASECLIKEGHRREVSVYFSKERFPVRRYGAIIFPAGEYLALRVDIGEGKGHNWWCALYPELCYSSDWSCLTEKGKADLAEAASGRYLGKPVRAAATGLGDGGAGAVWTAIERLN